MVDDNHFYVQISDSATVRKALLGNSKQVIGLLKRFEQLKLIRKKKTEELLNLRKSNKEINVLITKMKRLLPKSEMRVKLQREKKTPVMTEEAPIPKSELAKLEAELKGIERKINSLG